LQKEKDEMSGFYPVLGGKTNAFGERREPRTQVDIWRDLDVAANVGGGQLSGPERGAVAPGVGAAVVAAETSPEPVYSEAEVAFLLRDAVLHPIRFN
jgi:hypothetical protein